MEVLEAQICFAGAPLLLNTTKEIFFRIALYLEGIMDLPGLWICDRSISQHTRADRIQCLIVNTVIRLMDLQPKKFVWDCLVTYTQYPCQVPKFSQRINLVLAAFYSQATTAYHRSYQLLTVFFPCIRRTPLSPITQRRSDRIPRQPGNPSHIGFRPIALRRHLSVTLPFQNENSPKKQYIREQFLCQYINILIY